jgi:hypothetical protein
MLVRTILAGTVIIHGVPSRRVYTWENNNLVDILEEDLPDLLAKKEIRGGCCGAPRIERNLFELAE